MLEYAEARTAAAEEQGWPRKAPKEDEVSGGVAIIDDSAPGLGSSGRGAAEEKNEGTASLEPVQTVSVVAADADEEEFSCLRRSCSNATLFSKSLFAK